MLPKKRRDLGIQRMILFGHSFGGYFSALYTMKYPQYVERLVLASPVGMPAKKTDSPITNPSLRSDLPYKRQMFLGLAETFWTNYWTPQAFVRTFGPWGKRLVAYYVIRGSRSALTHMCFGEFWSARRRRISLGSFGFRAPPSMYVCMYVG